MWLPNNKRKSALSTLDQFHQVCGIYLPSEYFMFRILFLYFPKKYKKTQKCTLFIKVEWGSRVSHLQEG